MKKLGHLNRDIARVLAKLGHTDSLVIADCGLPIPPGVECIDVSLSLGEPSFLRVLATIVADMAIEQALFADEINDRNPAVAQQAKTMAQSGVQVLFVPHEIFKQRTQTARAIIRTGEAAPYANVILYAGVIF